MLLIAGCSLDDERIGGDSGPAGTGTTTASGGSATTSGSGESSGDDSEGGRTGSESSTSSSSGSSSSSEETSSGSAGDEGDLRFDTPDGATAEGGQGEECNPVVDVVFVMDVSTSMDLFFEKLEADIEAVDVALRAIDSTIDPRYGLAVFVDDALVVNMALPYPDIATLRADFAHWHAFTATNGQTKDPGCGQHVTDTACMGEPGCTWLFGFCLGTQSLNSTWTENSLDGLAFAAEQFAWRPVDQTQRIIIHTTDDTFWEGPAMQNGVMIFNDYASTVTKLRDRSIRVFSFADTIGGDCECNDVSMGWSTPYKGQPSIPDATGGGVFDIQAVLAGSVSLADAIPKAIEEKRCDPYPVG